MNYCTPYPVAVNRRFLSFRDYFGWSCIGWGYRVCISRVETLSSKPRETHAEYFTLAALFASNALYSAVKVRGLLGERYSHFRLKGTACQ
jgi:hypothetical protein